MVMRAFRNPISSLETLMLYLKYYPPDGPYYIRFIGSRKNDYTDAGLFTTRRVSPTEIRYCSPQFDTKWEPAGKVLCGEWDLQPAAFEDASFCDGVDASFYQSLEAHFECGVEWEKTPFVREVLDLVDVGQTVWTCDDRDDVEKKCARVDSLYERIAERGYKTHEERLQENVEDLKPTRKTALYRWLKKHTVIRKEEVSVNVGRDGTLLFLDGKHRLSIAKILGLDSIPVIILARHDRWQEVRDRVAAGGKAEIPADLRDHPDLRDIS